MHIIVSMDRKKGRNQLLKVRIFFVYEEYKLNGDVKIFSFKLVNLDFSYELNLETSY